LTGGREAIVPGFPISAAIDGSARRDADARARVYNDATYPSGPDPPSYIWARG
jgi:hypothetical protein